jgi:hypothetical protein
MKMSKSKASKAYEIISTNPKMDTSGMAGKPKEFEMMSMMTYKPPVMTIGDMLEAKEYKTSKKPELES